MVLIFILDFPLRVLAKIGVSRNQLLVLSKLCVRDVASARTHCTGRIQFRMVIEVNFEEDWWDV